MTLALQYHNWCEPSKKILVHNIWGTLHPNIYAEIHAARATVPFMRLPCVKDEDSPLPACLCSMCLDYLLLSTYFIKEVHHFYCEGCLKYLDWNVSRHHTNMVKKPEWTVKFIGSNKLGSHQNRVKILEWTENFESYNMVINVGVNFGIFGLKYMEKKG